MTWTEINSKKSSRRRKIAFNNTRDIGMKKNPLDVVEGCY